MDRVKEERCGRPGCGARPTVWLSRGRAYCAPHAQEALRAEGRQLPLLDVSPEPSPRPARGGKHAKG